MRDTNEEYWEVIKGVIGALIILAIFIIFFLTGCKTISHLKKATNDSTSVKKVNEGSVKSDSSGSKSESTKETVYYPQPIIVPGKDGETKVIFVPQTVKETGKTEEAKVVKDESWREAFDSLSSKILSLSQDKKTKVGLSFIEWMLVGAVGLMFLKSFSPPIIKFLHNTITKT